MQVAGAETALHQHRIDPSAELETDRRQYSDVPEAEFLVQPDRGRVLAVADHRNHLAFAGVFAASYQLREQRTADAFAGEIRMHVNRVLHRVAISRTRAVDAGVRITCNSTAGF